MDAIRSLNAALSGRYRIERELGRGGMATVYLAFDTRHDRRVAVKVLHPELAAALGGERFLAEIKTTANLQHPHILPLHDSGEADGLLFYVMPFIDGESLRDRLTRERQLPIDDALRIAREVADALGYAHANGVIHRDIKPENILLQGGHALVADFGIALAVQHAGGARMTQTGLSLGTPQYMSPEQAMGEKSIDARADLYALGAVTYEMLSGEPPFTGPTVQSIVAKVINDVPRPLDELRKSVPPHVADAVARALEKLPADRIGSAKEFAAALAGDRPVHVTTSRKPRVASRIPTNTALTVGLATIAAAAIGWALFGNRTGTPSASVIPARFSLAASVSAGGFGNSIAVSADGSKIAYTSRDPGSTRIVIMLRRLEDDSSVVIPGTGRGINPFFSPNGESLGFTLEGRVMRVDFGGGGARSIAKFDAPVVTGAWGTRGTIAVSVRGKGIYVVPEHGGAPRLINPGDSAIHSHVSWLPDGERLLVSSARDDAGGEIDALIMSAETGEVLARPLRGLPIQYVEPGIITYVPREGGLMSVRVDPRSLELKSAPTPVVASAISLIAYFGRSRRLAISPSGTVVFAGAVSSERELVTVTANGSAQVLPLGRRAFRGPRFSPDGKQIAVDVEPGGDLLGDVWIYDRAATTFSRVTFEGTSVFPEWSPDGKSIVYSASDSGLGRNLYRVPIDRSAPPKRIASGAWPMLEGVLTSNGALFYRENSEVTGRDIFMVPANGKPEPFATTAAMERSATPSADGRFVLYVSDESGSDEVYVRRLEGGGRAQVSMSGGVEPRWAPGGREVFYWNADTLFAVSVEGPGGLAVGARRRVLAGEYEREPFHSNYDVAPDGKTFVMIRGASDRETETITVLMNWLSPNRAKSETP